MTEQPSQPRTGRGRLFAPASFLESSRVAQVLRAETVRRDAAHVRRGHGAGLGELALVVDVRRRAGLVVGSAPSAPPPQPGRVGRRRAAGDLLLRRGAGAQARVRRRRAARPAAGRPAGGRRGRRDGVAGPDLPRRERGPGHLARLGDPDRDGHRVRGRRTGRDQLAPAERRCAPSCSPSPWSTTCWRSRSSRSSTPSGCTSSTSRWPCCPWRRSRSSPTPDAHGVPPAAVRARDLGARARVRGARDGGGGAARLRHPGAARGPARARSGRAPRAPGPAGLRRAGGSGVRVLRRRGDRRRAERVRRRARPTPSRSASWPGWWSARWWGSRGRPGCSRRSRVPTSTRTSAGSTSSACRCWRGSGSRSRC